MITVRFTGGARKSFDTDEIILDKNNLTVRELVDYLISTKPENSTSFDGKNLLIAVNGTDSSALDGHQTILNDNDVINIIPIIFHFFKRLIIEFICSLISNFIVSRHNFILNRNINCIRSFSFIF